MPLKPGVRRLAWLVAPIAASLLGIAGLGVAYLTRTRVDPERERNAALQRKHVQAYLDDLDFLKREPFFRPPPPDAKDASAALGSKVPWQPRAEIEGPVDRAVDRAAERAVERPVDRLVEPGIRDKLLRLRGDWIEHPGAFRSAKADYEALKIMRRYQTWDLEASGPVAKLTAERAFVPPSRLPSPDPVEIGSLVKLRLVRAIEDEDMLEALRDARQAAKLLFSTESFQLQLAALSLLDVERRAYRHYVERGLFDEGAWRPVERPVTRRAMRAIWATRGYLRLLTPGDVMDATLLDQSREPLGLCAAANESFPIEFSLKPLLSGRWPFEDDYSEAYARLDRVLSRARRFCRLRYLGALIEADRFESDLPVPTLFARLPWTRQMFGARLSSLNFVGFDGYENPDAR